MTPVLRAFAVFLKAPVPGAVKTRLSPVLTPDEAAALHRAFARDTLSTVQAWAELSENHRPWLAYQSHWRFPDPRWAGTDFPHFKQDGADMGNRLARAFEFLFSQGHGAVVVGADAPDLPIERLVEAFRALEKHDAVLGPAGDGGYYLVGLRRPLPELFRGMPWSSGRLLAESAARLDDLGLSYHLLEPHDDVDTFEDVAHLARRLAAGRGRNTASAAAIGDLTAERVP